jgi:restriction system protein
MGAASHWIIAIIAALAVGIAGTLYFRNVRMRRDETDAGIVALSAVSWRVFVHMVLDAWARRGYERVPGQDDGAADRDFMLEKDGRHWLLSCRHGSAFVLGKPAVQELANEIGLKGADGGFLVTQGRIADDARKLAALHRIELFDGTALWPELRGFIAADQLAAIRAHAAERARQGTLLAWLAALVAGIGVFFALPEPRRPVSVPPIATPAPATDTSPAAAPSVAAPAADAAPEIPLEMQRQALLNAVSTLADVDRAVWSSESTLQIYLARIDGDAFQRICPLVERYDALASSRIQLTPPPGSDARVRFRQCRSY